MSKRIIENPNLCPLTFTMNAIGNKWKPIIIHTLGEETMRYGKIHFMIPSISNKILSEQLKELEADGILIRKKYAETPPKVEYNLSQKGLELLPILQSLGEWGLKYTEIYQQNV